MRRVPVGLAFAAVLALVGNACTSFPALTDESASGLGDDGGSGADKEDGASSSDSGGDGSRGQGEGDGSSGGDGSTGLADASGSDDSGPVTDASTDQDSGVAPDAGGDAGEPDSGMVTDSGTKDSGGQPDAAPDPCKAAVINCTTNPTCPQCPSKCGCTLSPCCETEIGNGTYASCCAAVLTQACPTSC